MHCAGVRIIGFGSFTLDLLHTSGPSYERHSRTAKFTVPWRVHDEWKSKSHFLYCQKHTPFLRATISTYSRGGSLVRLQTVGTYMYWSRVWIRQLSQLRRKTGRMYYVILWKPPPDCTSTFVLTVQYSTGTDISYIYLHNHLTLWFHPARTKI